MLSFFLFVFRDVLSPQTKICLLGDPTQLSPSLRSISATSHVDANFQVSYSLVDFLCHSIEHDKVNPEGVLNVLEITSRSGLGARLRDIGEV